MKFKLLIAAFTAVLMLVFMCACGAKTENAETTAQTEQTAALEQTEADETTQTTQQPSEVETVSVEMPTNSGGTLEDSGLVVTDITAYDRTGSGELVRETAMKDLELKKSTVEKDGEEIQAYVGEYTVSQGADTVFFSLVCSLNEMTDIALGKEFARADGDSTFEAKYMADSELYPLIITVKF